MTIESFSITLEPTVSFGIPLAEASPDGSLKTYLQASLQGQPAEGSVESVNGVLPDVDGNVELTPADIGAQPAGDYLQNTATGLESLCVGNGSDASGAGSVALGDNTNASNDAAVAIGNGSETTRDGEVSVGNEDGLLRYVANVRSGALPTDATNLGQVEQLIADIPAAPVDSVNGQTGVVVIGAFTAAADGLVPAPVTPANKYLRDDGTWQTVAASPGGSSGQLQYNSGGAFAGVPGVTHGSNTTLVTSQAAAAIPFAVQAATSQTGNLTEWRNSVGTVLTSITSAGGLSLMRGQSLIDTPFNGTFTFCGASLANPHVYFDSAGISVRSTGYLGCTNSSSNAATTLDTTLRRAAAGIWSVAAGSANSGGALQFQEMAAPAAGAADSVRIFAQDNGAGKTQLMAIFSSGAAQQMAIQP